MAKQNSDIEGGTSLRVIDPMSRQLSEGGEPSPSSPPTRQDDKSFLAALASGGAGADADLSSVFRFTPMFEPLKVCLDDDTSDEGDGDDDMFDDEDFYFGDEDFEALLSSDVFKRVSTPLANSAQQARGVVLVAPACDAGASTTTTTMALDQQPSMVSDSEGSTSATDMSSIEGEGASSSSASLENLTYLSQESSTSQTSTAAAKRPKTKRRVALHSDVTVVPIPMRNEYPNEVRERLWSTAAELYANAVRNSVEFAAEGWNWRTVYGDERMAVSASGERIHPIHFFQSPSQTMAERRQGHAESTAVEVAATSSVCMDVEPIVVA